MTRAQIFNIQRYSTEDGPGIRTTVFFKGCPLRCAWCHNPESMRRKSEMMWTPARCIHCDACIGVCPQQGLARGEDGELLIDRRRCDACATCAEECPAGAIERVGEEWEIEALAEEVARDRVFYQTSGGGVTLGGGEPLAQPEAAGALMAACRERGMHVALDTSAFARGEVFDSLTELADLVLLDIKTIDNELHRAFTGVESAGILDNARRLRHRMSSVWVSTPVIPGYTDAPECIAAIGDWIASNLPEIARWRLLPFNRLGAEKWRRLDLPHALRQAQTPDDEVLSALLETARAHAGVETSCPLNAAPSASVSAK